MPGPHRGDVHLRSRQGRRSYEVGYEVRGGIDAQGCRVWSAWKVLGRGASWEEAFSDADRRPATLPKPGAA